MSTMVRAAIRETGWHEYSVWEHSAHIREVYTARVRREVPELIYAAQAAELVAARVRPGEVVLDAGCGVGHLWHSLNTRQIPAEYFGIDASSTFIQIGQKFLPDFGLPSERLKVARIENLSGTVDHVLCLNVLSHIDNYHRPLERLLKMARRTVVIRESLAPQGSYHYVTDRFLDAGVELKVYVNTYPLAEVMNFIQSYGWRVHDVVDAYTGGKPQDVIGYPHYWRFLIAEK